MRWTPPWPPEIVRGEIETNRLDSWFANCEHSIGIVLGAAQVHVVGGSRLDAFARNRADAGRALAGWRRAVRSAAWENFAQVRETFNSADIVGQFTVFNVRGNRYRVIAEIDHSRHTIYIRDVLTHAEYDQGRWKRGIS